MNIVHHTNMCKGLRFSCMFFTLKTLLGNSLSECLPSLIPVHSLFFFICSLFFHLFLHHLTSLPNIHSLPYTPLLILSATHSVTNSLTNLLSYLFIHSLTHLLSSTQLLFDSLTYYLSGHSWHDIHVVSTVF